MSEAKQGLGTTLTLDGQVFGFSVAPSTINVADIEKMWSELPHPSDRNGKPLANSAGRFPNGSYIDFDYSFKKEDTITMTGHFDPEPESPEITLFQDYLKRFTYKPGWSFSIEPYNIDIIINIDIRCLCSRTNELILQTFHNTIEPIISSEDEFFEFLKECILKIEKHEALEFFVVDGKKPFDPHKMPFDGQMRSGYW